MTDDAALNTGLLLYIPYRWLENRVFDALAKAGYDITVAQMKIVQRIGPDGTRLTDLAEQAQVTKQTAGFLVDQLEKAGWVERVPDPSDKRARLVRMSDRGKSAIPIADAAIAEIETEWEAHLGKQQMAQLRRILTKLRAITDPYA
ncbi:MarR family winged helix-turn-helix transcriptional regulator [Actinocrispum wychmicini]|uniref:DNA-binding MarR family transcriptional regulator n=1 Tax=Actinocrispum wychmicini TaxID=1213861 RepID=A0A4R2J7Q8_9PSEU|nr:MarR family transcriptional regulator [Actinocrispum wychmicini]TCO55193.1 DNA-binding MarR family transcriptional regulator [Actinocrispum wychmicini]